MLPYKGGSSLIFTGQPNLKLPEEYNIDLESLFQGTKKAVESISIKISKRDLSGLSSLVSPQCLVNLRERVFETIPPNQLSGIAIKADDIFFQYIESSDIQDDTIKVTLVGFSLENLEKSKQILERVKKFQADLHKSAAKTGGILRKEDMNAREFRRIRQEQEDLLANEGEIMVTSYAFEKQQSGQEDWTVTHIAHTDSREIWSYSRRLIWKGRVHFSVRFNKEFCTYLRYDYAINTATIILMIYLQILAILIGESYEAQEEAKRRETERTL